MSRDDLYSLVKAVRWRVPNQQLAMLFIAVAIIFPHISWGVAGSGRNGPGRDAPDLSAYVTTERCDTSHLLASTVQPDRVEAIRIKNQGSRGILAMCGTFTYLTPKERLKEVTWSHTFAGILALDSEEALEPGAIFETAPIPIHGRVGEFIEYIDYNVTGLVLAPDWEPMGEDGVYCRDLFADAARSAHRQVADLIRMAERDPAQFEKAIFSEEPLVTGDYSFNVHKSIQQRLISDGVLRKNYLQILSRIQHHLGSF